MDSLLRIPGLLLVLPLALSGCLGLKNPEAPSETPGGLRPFVEWREDPCDPNPGRGIARNAAWVPAWQGAPAEVMDRFARALGEPLPATPSTSDEGRWITWRSDTVQLRYRADERGAGGSGDLIDYATPKRWPGVDRASAETEMRAFLERFGVPPHVELEVVGADDGRASITQRFRGEAIGPAGGGALPGDGSGRLGWWSSFDLRPFWDLRAAEVRVAEAEAVSVARAFHGCVMDREGHTEDAGYRLASARAGGLHLRNASVAIAVALAYTRPPPPAHCELAAWSVFVDARTGAVHGSEVQPCD